MPYWIKQVDGFQSMFISEDGIRRHTDRLVAAIRRQGKQRIHAWIRFGYQADLHSLGTYQTTKQAKSSVEKTFGFHV